MIYVMNRINTFSYKGKDIEMLYRNGSLAYSFEHEGKTYGIAVKLPSKSINDISATTWLLIQNAVETLEALLTNINENK